MERYSGRSVNRGLAVGKIVCRTQGGHPVRRISVTDPGREVERFDSAREKALDELDQLHEDAIDRVGRKNASIFEAQAAMLDDADFNDSVLNMIRTQSVNAEYAVSISADNFSEMFRQMDDEYFRARAADIQDVSRRLVRIMTGAQTDKPLAGPAVIAADDLLPSETMQLDSRSVLAFVTREGSSLSHAAILARVMGIPAVAGMPVEEDWNGRLAIVDGDSGTLILDPDEETLAEAQAMRSLTARSGQELLDLKGKPTVTRDGKYIHLYANIGTLRDVASALENDAEGIGLFRTEFLYMGRDDLPGEEEQFRTYRQVAEMMAGRPVTVRTMDFGSEMQGQLLHLKHEKNPALGFRGIRMCLSRPGIFRTQLRAIYRASMYGNLSIMYPMITSVEEVRRIHEIVRSVQEDLTAHEIPWRRCETGIMIETPASVLFSDELAREVDFFSIGTNDLTQYTLAMDRQNGALTPYYDARSEAVLREIEYTVHAAHRHGCRIAVCGELGSDISMTDRFMKLGIDELSVSPSMVLPVRKAVRESSTEPGDPSDSVQVNVKIVAGNEE